MGRFPTLMGSFPECLKSGKEKAHININEFGGLSWDWVGGRILFMCFWWSFLRGGENTYHAGGNCRIHDLFGGA